MSPPLTQSAAGDKVLRRVDTGDDIEDPLHYSIEDAKQKAEHDRKLKAAEAKKQKVSTANTCNNIIVYSIILATV